MTKSTPSKTGQPLTNAERLAQMKQQRPASSTVAPATDAAPQLDVTPMPELGPDPGTTTPPVVTPVAESNPDVLYVPTEYQAPAKTLGQIPAVVADGYFVTRIRDESGPLAEAKSMQRYPVKPTNRSQFDPSELIIQNPELFPVNAQGYLTFRGDLLVVSSMAVEQARLAANHRTAILAQYSGDDNGVTVDVSEPEPVDTVPDLPPQVRAAMLRDGLTP